MLANAELSTNALLQETRLWLQDPIPDKRRNNRFPGGNLSRRHRPYRYQTRIHNSARDTGRPQRGRLGMGIMPERDWRSHKSREEPMDIRRIRVEQRRNLGICDTAKSADGNPASGRVFRHHQPSGGVNGRESIGRMVNSRWQRLNVHSTQYHRQISEMDLKNDQRAPISTPWMDRIQIQTMARHQVWPLYTGNAPQDREERTS